MWNENRRAIEIIFQRSWEFNLVQPIVESQAVKLLLSNVWKNKQQLLTQNKDVLHKPPCVEIAKSLISKTIGCCYWGQIQIKLKWTEEDFNGTHILDSPSDHEEPILLKILRSHGRRIPVYNQS